MLLPDVSGEGRQFVSGVVEIGTHGDIALLQIDSMLLFPIVDRLLGGSGGPSELSRESPRSKIRLPKNFVRLVCQELQIGVARLLASQFRLEHGKLPLNCRGYFRPTTTRWYSTSQSICNPRAENSN